MCSVFTFVSTDKIAKIIIKFTVILFGSTAKIVVTEEA